LTREARVRAVVRVDRARPVHLGVARRVQAFLATREVLAALQRLDGSVQVEEVQQHRENQHGHDGVRQRHVVVVVVVFRNSAAPPLGGSDSKFNRRIYIYVCCCRGEYIGTECIQIGLSADGMTLKSRPVYISFLYPNSCWVRDRGVV